MRPVGAGSEPLSVVSVRAVEVETFQTVSAPMTTTQTLLSLVLGD